MPLKSNSKIDYKTRVIPRQTVWNYMRRNRNFRAGDVLRICKISKDYFQTYLRSLMKAGYVEFTGKSNPFTNRQYKLKKCTGVKAPATTKHGLTDYNTGEEFNFRKTKEEKNIYAPDGLIKILEAIDDNEMTQPQIREKANVKKMVLQKYWDRLWHMGVRGERVAFDGDTWSKYNPKPKFKRDGNYIYFETNQERAKEVLEELKNGAYKVKSAELKHLWIR